MGLSFSVATTDTLRAEAFRLRYRVYVDEMKLPMRHADHHNGLLADELDASSTTVVALDGSAVVGTIRMSSGARVQNFGEYDQLYHLRKIFGSYYPRHVSVTTKLAVDPAYRKSLLPMSLCIYCFKLYISEGICFDTIDCQPKMIEIFRKLGYRQIQPDFVHPDDGKQFHFRCRCLT